MGVVWKAVDTTLDRVVAIKFLAEDRTRDEQRFARLKQEAVAVAALNHPNILQVFSVDEADGIPFLTMEYVNGGNLSASIPSQGLPLEEFFELAIPLADALHATHERNIVHRDLKPSNIMVGDDGRARIVDFGLAQLRLPGGADVGSKASTASWEEHPPGTLPYMSPEQLQGKPIDTRSDIFSLGDVLYQMATGKRPFNAENSADLVAAIMGTEPVPVTRLNPALPRELERIIERCMRKDRKRRFQTALDVRNELEDLRRQAPEADPARPSEDRPGPRPGAPDRNSVAVLPLRNIGGDHDLEYFTDGLTEDLISTLAQSRSLRVVSRTSAFTFKEQPLSTQEIGRRLGVGTVIEGGVQIVKRRIRVTVRLVETTQGYHLWGEKYDRELKDIFSIQDEISQSVARALSVKLDAGARSRHYTENLEAYQLYLKGRYHWHQETPEAFQKAFEYFEQALKTDPTYAPAHTGIADYYGMLGFWGIVKPSEAWPQARTAAQRALDLDSELPEAHVSLGLTRLFFDWDADGADREFRRALELYPGLAEAHYARALVFTQNGDTAAALAAMRNSRSLDPFSAILQSTEAWVHYYARHYSEAIAGCRRTLELNSSFLEARIGLGLALKEVREFDEAIREFTKARDLSDANPLVLGVLGATLAESGRKEEALALVQELDGKQGCYVAPMAYAMLYSGLGDLPQTLAHLRRALEAKDGLARYLKVLPLFDGFRRNPEFVPLLADLNLDVRPMGS